jgi:hypothetical protein
MRDLRDLTPDELELLRLAKHYYNRHRHELSRRVLAEVRERLGLEGRNPDSGHGELSMESGDHNGMVLTLPLL